MADTKGAAQEAMPMALPESMLIDAKHAIEEENMIVLVAGIYETLRFIPSLLK